MLHRTAGFVFDYGIFTNIEPDHIGPNEHRDFDHYLSCKAMLLSQCRTGIVNRDDEHFERIKRKLYGDYVTEYNSVANIARMFLADSFKGINSFDYIEKFNTVTKEYAEQILKELFNEEKMGISIINPK